MSNSSVTLDINELDNNKQAVVELDGNSILICSDGDNYYAVENACSHQGKPLLGGKCHNGTIFCPWHGACFNAVNGEVIDGPAFHPLLSCTVKKEGDQLTIERVNKQ